MNDNEASLQMFDQDKLRPEARHAALASALAVLSSEGVSASDITRGVRLAFLAPDIDEAILASTLRAGIDGVAMVRTGAVPDYWN